MSWHFWKQTAAYMKCFKIVAMNYALERMELDNIRRSGDFEWIRNQSKYKRKDTDVLYSYQGPWIKFEQILANPLSLGAGRVGWDTVQYQGIAGDFVYLPLKWPLDGFRRKTNGLRVKAMWQVKSRRYELQLQEKMKKGICHIPPEEP